MKAKPASMQQAQPEAKNVLVTQTADHMWMFYTYRTTVVLSEMSFSVLELDVRYE